MLDEWKLKLNSKKQFHFWSIGHIKLTSFLQLNCEIDKVITINLLFLGQGRLDGAFCDFSESDKMDYLQKLQRHGVVNIEMESLAFAALTHHAGIKSAVICVAIIDRLKGDQVCMDEKLWEIFVVGDCHAKCS